MTFLAQECGEAEERIGLSIDELRLLLKKAIALQVDNIKMLAYMQRHRAMLATNMDTQEQEADPKQFIISDKARDVQVRQAEARLAHDITARRPILRDYASKKPSFGGLQPRRPLTFFQLLGFQKLEDEYNSL